MTNELRAHMVKLGWDLNLFSLETDYAAATRQYHVLIRHRNGQKMVVVIAEYINGKLDYRGLPTPLDFTKHLMLKTAGH